MKIGESLALIVALLLLTPGGWFAMMILALAMTSCS